MLRAPCATENLQFLSRHGFSLGELLFLRQGSSKGINGYEGVRVLGTNDPALRLESGPDQLLGLGVVPMLIQKIESEIGGGTQSVWMIWAESAPARL